MPRRGIYWLQLSGFLSVVIPLSAANAVGLPLSAAGDASTPCLPAATPYASNAITQGQEASLVEAAMQSPNDFASQKTLGEFYLQQNRLLQGIRFLERAQQLNPADYNTGYDLSLAYLNCGHLRKASQQLRAMIARKETGELDSLLAEAFERSQDYKNAAVTYKRAADLDPTEDNIFDLASFLLQHPHYEGFMDGALAVFRYGVAKYPRSPKLAVGLGVTLYAEGKYDDAVESLCGAVDLDPTDPKPYQFLSKVSKVSQELMPKIRDRLEEFVRLYPNNGSAIYYYAMILWQQSDKEDPVNLKSIEMLFQKAIVANPRLYEAHFQLGVLYQNEDRYVDAISEFNQTVKLCPDFNQAHYRLALLYNRTHQKELAEKHLAILKQIKKQDAEEEGPENSAERQRPTTSSGRSK